MVYPIRFLGALIVLFISLHFADAETPFRYPEAKHGQGELKYRNGLPVVLVQGKPEAIGEQLAVLAAKPAPRVLDYPRELLAAHGFQFVWPWFVKVGGSMLPQFPADHRAEFDALVKAGLDRDRLVVGNTMFDVKKLVACSALIVEPQRSATQGPLFGRNLDYPSLGYIHQYSLVTVYRPEGKHAFVSIGFPGLVGCVSGMNDAGLALAVHEVYALKDGIERFDGKGIPYALCYRRLLEECTTIAEAEKLLRSMKRTTIINLAVCDRTGGAVFEVTPRDVVVRRPDAGLCSCTNHFLTDEHKPAREPNIFMTLDRFATLEKSRQMPKLGVADVQKQLHAVSMLNHTLQTMIFEPATLKLHLAIGACPSSGEPLKTLDLAPLFRSKPE